MKGILILCLVFIIGLCEIKGDTLRINLLKAANILDVHAGDQLKVGMNEWLFLANSQDYKIRVFDELGKFLHDFGREGSEHGAFQSGWSGGFDVGKKGLIYQADQGEEFGRIQVFDPEGKFLREIVVEGRGLDRLFVMKGEEFLIIRPGNKRVRKEERGLIFTGTVWEFVTVDKKGEPIITLQKPEIFNLFSSLEDNSWCPIPFPVKICSAFHRQSNVFAWQKDSEDTVHFIFPETGEVKSKKNGFKPKKITRGDLSLYFNEYVKKRPLRKKQVPNYQKLMNYGTTPEGKQPVIEQLLFDYKGSLHIFSKMSGKKLYQARVIHPKSGQTRTYTTKFLPVLIEINRIYSLVQDEKSKEWWLIIQDQE